MRHFHGSTTSYSGDVANPVIHRNEPVHIAGSPDTMFRVETPIRVVFPRIMGVVSSTVSKRH